MVPPPVTVSSKMVYDMVNVPTNLDMLIANALAIAIAMSDPQNYSDYRSARKIIKDLDDAGYSRKNLSEKNTRQNRQHVIPELLHLQLGLSSSSLRVHIERTFSVLFLRSRKESDYFTFMGVTYNAYHMKVQGDYSDMGHRNIGQIKICLDEFIKEERVSSDELLNAANSMAAVAIEITPAVGPESTRAVDTEECPVDNTTESLVGTRQRVSVPPIVRRKGFRSLNQPSLKEIKMTYTIKKMKQREKYAKKTRANRPINTVIEELIGNKLHDLVMKQNKYYDIINGKLCLSVRTGLFVQDLISNCGCSLEKMPIMISTVLRMLFGSINEVSMRKIVKCSMTYTTSSERTAALVKEQCSNKFLIRDNDSSILNAYLIMDATNKGDKSLVAKLYNYVCGDGVVRLGALNLDNTGISSRLVT